jgi:hypothetical protein
MTPPTSLVNLLTLIGVGLEVTELRNSGRRVWGSISSTISL